MKSFYLVLCFSLFLCGVNAQQSFLIVPVTVNLPKDTQLRKQLLNDLNGFLSQKEKANHENTFVAKAFLLETSLLLDEMKGMDKSSKYQSDTFYKPYLTNVLKLNDSVYKIQLAYLAVNEGQPLLRAGFTLIAHKISNQFYFSSPLAIHTKHWDSRTFGDNKVYYKKLINKANATKYFNMIQQYDKKLSAPSMHASFYCCDNFSEAQQVAGIDFKSDFNGRSFGSLTAKENNMHLTVNGYMTSNFTTFDPHDLWHARLHLVLSTDIINRPVDEGTAYLYGGSWGLTWNEILNRFKTFASNNPSADWITLYNESKNFDEKSTYPLNVDMVINALIVQKLEKDKGFSAVIELLSCGKQEIGNENYFLALEKIAGIKKADFNKTVWALIGIDKGNVH